MRASARYADSNDKITGTSSDTFEQAAQLSALRRVWDGRSLVQGSYQFGHSVIDTTARPGGVIRTPVNGVRHNKDRATMGVKLMNLPEDVSIVAIARTTDNDEPSA